MDERLRRLRAADRLSAPTVIKALLPTMVAQHGDRVLGDDAALTAGFGRTAQQQGLAVLGIDRGHDLKTRREKNGGALAVAGYRTAQRVVQHAEKFGFPVVSLINMPGADASPKSERFGQSQAIADLIATMGQLTVPNLVVFLGEGHSGGALAFANANAMIMLDDSLFNVASPEAVAAILHGQQTVSEAIDLLPMTAADLQRRGLVDQVIDHQRPDLVATLCQQIITTITTLQTQSASTLIAQREAKFQAFLDQWPQA
ncbi:carboxyltransferase subunit alpha [Lactiplantibacillus sp. WILCCON 0030]|uniref:acetyl-CoA carboxytransferase n=1 Tax=Lactiplantibacillus brownii TaxID=3069269 RepID=A0ABU1A6C1_9LACO|nr:carboxyltransferase subunit alpha [Lactiplantibacillus brownii]MDQ7936499.1 carboxyltransferase subunit alpha [Lactiplantibacillus brownii]